MNRPVLVDSSWYIQRFREKQDPLLILAAHSAVRDIAVCGIVICEVGRGLGNPRVRERYESAWAKMMHVESCKQRWTETMDIAWQLDRGGAPLPLPDLHIAICALHINAVILTEDQHFQKIPGVDATNRIY